MQVMTLNPKYDLKEYDSVYGPAEDTFLLLDLLDECADAIRATLAASEHPSALEMGCGSGVVTAHLLSRILDDMLRGKLQMTCVDVNEQALKATAHTLQCNGLECCKVTCTRSDLFDAISDDTHFDVILFNPPYVPTDDAELNKVQTACGANDDSLDAALAGGIRGRRVIDRFLAQLSNRLKANGICYMIAIDKNDIKELTSAEFCAQRQLRSRKVAERRCGIEKIFVIEYKQLCDAEV